MPPPTVHSIGDDTLPLNEGTTWFKFVSMNGVVPTPQERIERVLIPGVPYQTYRHQNTSSGEPFVLRTVRDVEDIDAGRALLKNYVTLKTTGQKLIKDDYNYETEDSLLVFVLDVIFVRLHAVTWCNAFDDTNEARLEVDWQLEFRDV